jgi:nucleotide-binding universal stress UspA family protein
MFSKILIPLDRSSLAEQAIGQAVAIARASHAEIDVVLVHDPLPFAGYGDAPWNAEQWSDENRYVESIATEIASGAGMPVTHAVVRGGPVEMICGRARDVNADLIVMTSHGRTGLSRAWIGSVADGVLRKSSVPVLVLRPIEGKTARVAAHRLFERVLVPLDGSALAADILGAAAALAACGSAQVVLLRVVQPVPIIAFGPETEFGYPPVVQDDVATDALVVTATKELVAVAQRLREEGVAEVEAQIVVGARVAQAILDFARSHEVDAIAMSTHGRGASRLIFGSVADKVLRGSELPVLLHRPVGVGNEKASIDASNHAQQPQLTSRS